MTNFKIFLETYRIKNDGIPNNLYICVGTKINYKMRVVIIGHYTGQENGFFSSHDDDISTRDDATAFLFEKILHVVDEYVTPYALIWTCSFLARLSIN